MTTVSHVTKRNRGTFCYVISFDESVDIGFFYYCADCKGVLPVIVSISDNLTFSSRERYAGEVVAQVCYGCDEEVP